MNWCFQPPTINGNKLSSSSSSSSGQGNWTKRGWGYSDSEDILLVRSNSHPPPEADTLRLITRNWLVVIHPLFSWFIRPMRNCENQKIDRWWLCFAPTDWLMRLLLSGFCLLVPSTPPPLPSDDILRSSIVCSCCYCWKKRAVHNNNNNKSNLCVWGLVNGRVFLDSERHIPADDYYHPT